MKKNIFLFVVIMALAQIANAQCFPNRHSTNFFDGWISCETAPNPNPLRPESHFIMYDFKKVYKLGQMQIWNANDPAHLDWGMRDVAIDYSVDGENWQHAGDFTFPQASGLNTYEGTTGPYLFDVEARFMLITGLNNYGGECFGLGELRVSGEEVIVTEVDDITEFDCVEVSMFPNPFAEKMTLMLQPECSGEMRIVLFDALGHKLLADQFTLSGGFNKGIEIGKELPAGSYMLYIEFGGQSVQKSIVKMSKT